MRMMNLGKMSSEKQGAVSGKFAVKNLDRNNGGQIGFTKMAPAEIVGMKKRM